MKSKSVYNTHFSDFLRAIAFIKNDVPVLDGNYYLIFDKLLFALKELTLSAINDYEKVTIVFINDSGTSKQVISKENFRIIANFSKIESIAIE